MHAPATLDEDVAQSVVTDEASGYVCPTCGVQPTDAKVRRYRMGCIRLRKPVAHLWYFRNTPNILSVLMNISAGQTDELLHFDSYTPASANVMNYFLHGGTEWYIDEWDAVHATFGTAQQKPIVEFTDDGYEPEEGDIEAVWNIDAWAQGAEKKTRYDFPLDARTTQNCGAEAMHALLSQLDLPFMERMLSTRLRQKVQKYHTKLREKQVDGKFENAVWDIEEWNEREGSHNKTCARKLLKVTRQGQRNRGLNAKIKKLAKRLHYVRLLARKQLRPEWMIVSVFPVLPPDLRPMIQMSSGRFAASDLNDLYRRLIAE